MAAFGPVSDVANAPAGGRHRLQILRLLTDGKGWVPQSGRQAESAWEPSLLWEGVADGEAPDTEM